MKTRLVIIAAASAFVLSFFTALISKSGFGFSLLKGIVFAAVFGGIAVGVQILFAKFLAVDIAAEQDQLPEEAGKSAGSKIDFVVGEEELPEDDGAPLFNVDGSPHVLLASDIDEETGGFGSEESGGGEERDGAPFVALDLASGRGKSDGASGTLGKGAPFIPDMPAAQSAASSVASVAGDLPGTAAPNGVSEDAGGMLDAVVDAGAAESAEKSSAAVSDGDALPDLGRFSEFDDTQEEDASQDGDNDDTMEDVVVSDDDDMAPLPRVRINETELAEGLDSSVMASAVRTVLERQK